VKPSAIATATTMSTRPIASLEALAIRRSALRAFTLLFLLSAMTVTLRAQDGTSLGDIARQTKAQKAAAGQAAPSKAQELADELQQEQEETENAPVGFKTYNAGEYRLYVPFPFELEGRDDMGTVLVGSRLGVTNTEVLVGNPIPVPPYYGDMSDNTIAGNVVRQLSRRWAQNAGCVPTKLGERRAFACSLGNGYLMNHQIWGTMVWIIASNSVIPVMCASPDPMDEHLVYGNPRATYQQKQAAYARQAQRFRDERTTAQVCEQVIYPSIRLKEDDSQSAAKASEAISKPAKPAEAKGLATMPNPTAALVPASVQENAQGGAAAPSVADLAREAKLSSAREPKARLAEDSTGGTLAPAGFKAQSFSYCKSQGNCWQGSVFVPHNAVQVSQYPSELVYEVPLGDSKVRLFAGPAGIGGCCRNSNDPELIRWEEMNDPEGWVARGRVRAVRHEEATVAGKPGILTHFEISRDGIIWVGARANVESHGVVILVGCMAPQAHFADADQTCSGLIDSLRLP
jgi:hypothetical protein